MADDPNLVNQILNNPDNRPILAFIDHIHHLPLEVIAQILRHLNPPQLLEVLTECYSLAPFTKQLVDLIYGQTIEFIFEPSRIRFQPGFKKISDIELAAKFLSIPHFKIKKLLIVVSNVQLEAFHQLIIDKFHQLSSSFEEISVVFGNAIVPDDHKIFHLSNLSALSFANSTISSQLLTQVHIVNHGKLNHLTLDLLKTSDDNLISTIPIDITTLEVITGWNRPTSLTQTSWPFNSHITQFKDLVNLKIGFVDISDDEFYDLLSQTQLLVKLEAISINIVQLKVSELPRTLTFLNLSNNQNLTSVDIKDDYYWPMGLREIYLNNCKIDNKSFLDLCEYHWPLNLVKLEMVNNMFTDIEKLDNLPPEVETVKIACSLVGSSNRENQYQFFRAFPPQIKILEVHGCRFKESQSIHFPDTMVALAITNSEIFNGTIFKSYPKNLTALNLSSCNISHIDLSNLESLQILHLFNNSITSLRNIQLPYNLKHFRLNGNNITDLTKQDQLFNAATSVKFKSLISLRLIQNNIDDIDPDISLPPNLHELFLSNNNIINFIVPESISSHKRLKILDMSKNKIEDIRFAHEDRFGSAVSLKTFNLSLNNINKFDAQRQPRQTVPFSLAYEYNKRIEIGFGKRLQVVDGNLNRLLMFK